MSFRTNHLKFKSLKTLPGNSRDHSEATQHQHSDKAVGRGPSPADKRSPNKEMARISGRKTLPPGSQARWTG